MRLPAHSAPKDSVRGTEVLKTFLGLLFLFGEGVMNDVVLAANETVADNAAAAVVTFRNADGEFRRALFVALL